MIARNERRDAKGRNPIGGVRGMAVAFLTLALFSALPADAAAAAGSRLTAEGATLDLVAAPPAADGTVRAALLVTLDDGWHTYWRDPGVSGIPPSLDLTGTPGLSNAETFFEAPRRFGSGMTRANGYTGRTAFAFTLRPKPGATLGPVDAAIFMGVCKEICIPVEAHLTAETGPQAQGQVEAAFAALPARREGGGKTVDAQLSPDGKRLDVTVTLPKDWGASTTPTLFVAGPDGWTFDEPQPASADGRQRRYRVPVLSKPESDGEAKAASVGAEASGPSLDIVVTDGDRAFEAKTSVKD